MIEIDRYFEQPCGVLNPDNFGDKSVVAVNVTKSIDAYLDMCGEIISGHVLAAAQEAWRMNCDRASDCSLVLAYYKRGEQRLVIGAFAVDGKWFRIADTDRRMVFFGYPSPNRKDYEGCLLPPMAPGARNPVKYYD